MKADRLILSQETYKLLSDQELIALTCEWFVSDYGKETEIRISAKCEPGIIHMAFKNKYLGFIVWPMGENS